MVMYDARLLVYLLVWKVLSLEEVHDLHLIMWRVIYELGI
jgi:hypothetical protein